MKKLEVRNPFSAPVYYEETVESTMEVSKQLACEGAAHGTVFFADFQTKGRGRIAGRLWEMNSAENLSFTVILRYPGIENIPAALTLRAGLSVLTAIEEFAPVLKGRIKVKWPNDIMIESCKAAGILCEAENGNVYLGIGINTAQKEFPAHLRGKAASIALASGMEIKKEERFSLLEKILEKLYEELEKNKNDWKIRLEQRLYKKGEEVIFTEGAADSGKIIKGIILGIGDSGELLIMPEGEALSRSFFSGEITFNINL